MRNAFIDTVIDACRNRDDIYVLSGDAGLGVFDGFKKEFPGRFRNMGVAEQNTISFAAGLTMAGYKVVVYNIIPFVLYRCYEQVRNDICYQELPVVLVGIGSGITYAPMGMSHYSVEDIGIAKTLPNLETISPADPAEARAAAVYALDSTRPAYVRLAKRGEPTYHLDEGLDITVPHVIRGGKETAIVFHGSISDEVMAAHTALTAMGMTPKIISVPMLQPLATDSLLACLSDIRNVICVEEHFINCGLGSMLSQLKTECQASWGLNILGIPASYIHLVGKTDFLRARFGISSTDIVRAVLSRSGD
jgi:transketolase